jgi:hypothetical protein
MVRMRLRLVLADRAGAVPAQPMQLKVWARLGKEITAALVLALWPRILAEAAVAAQVRLVLMQLVLLAEQVEQEQLLLLLVHL